LADGFAASTDRRPEHRFDLPAAGQLPPAVRLHLVELTGRLGIYQHARGPLPDPGHGYCTDDVARAAVVDVVQGRALGHQTVADSLDRNVSFLAEAYVPATGRMRNFCDDDGNWLEREGSPDAHARSIRALGVILGEDGLRQSTTREARRLMDLLLPAASNLDGLRPWAHTIIGCVAALGAGRSMPSALAVLDELAARLAARFEGTSDDWPWPESAVTYENALLPQALIQAGDRLGDRSMVSRGAAVLSWLLDGQVEPAGYVVLVGNRGWWPRNGAPARYDQQPIDADALVEACAAAWQVDRDPAWLDAMEQSYGWFLGSNSVGIAVAEPARGACGDGLTAIGVSANQGAESTLAWLAATECVRSQRLAALPTTAR
jgi:hypothetical protein